MVFLNAYLDASLDRDGGLSVVAGYAGQAEHFVEIEDRWRNYLAVDRLDYFHLHDVRERFVDWRIVAEKYAQLLSKTKLFAAGAVINDKAWSRVDVSAAYKKLFPRREHACLDLALSTLAESIKESDLSGPVSVYIDSDYGSKQVATAIFENWQKRTGHRVLTLMAADPGASRMIVPLQFADLLANAIRMDPTTDVEMPKIGRAIMEEHMRFPLRHALKEGLTRIWNPQTAQEIADQASAFNDLVAIPAA